MTVGTEADLWPSLLAALAALCWPNWKTKVCEQWCLQSRVSRVGTMEFQHHPHTAAACPDPAALQVDLTRKGYRNVGVNPIFRFPAWKGPDW